MSINQHVSEVLRDIEKALAAQAHKALEKKEYSDLSELAKISKKVRYLVRFVEDRGQQRASTNHGGTFSSSTQRTYSTSKQIVKQYPEFSRVGNSLVKTAWSRKKREEYEHRVAKDVVMAVATAFRKTGIDAISLKELLPIQDGSGQEVPSYQVYLVVAWLLTCDALRKARRGVYQPVPENLAHDALEQRWVTCGQDQTKKKGVSENDE